MIPKWNAEHFATGLIKEKFDTVFRMFYIKQLRLLHTNCNWAVPQEDYEDYMWFEYILDCSAESLEQHHRDCRDIDDPHLSEDIRADIRQKQIDLGTDFSQVHRPSWDEFYIVDQYQLGLEDTKLWADDLLNKFEQCDCGGLRNIRTQKCANCIRSGVSVA